jgi:hypothetical protein
MLERIENFYLLCLRIVVIVAATLALVVFIWACSQGLPFLTSQLNVGQQGERPTASLADYIAEQQPTASGQGAGSTEIGGSNTAVVAPTKVAEAAKLLTHYAISRKVSVDTSNLTAVFMSRRDDVPDDDRAAYDENLLDLMRQLDASRGAPLTTDRINQLLNWQKAKFLDAAEGAKTKKGLDAAKASASLMIGISALGSFLLIIFFFIFVKIERNLRLVRTVEVAP